MRRTLLFISCLLASLAMSAQEYYPEGTKWTEIRLDTLKYDSWYSKVGDEWVPNFETIDYYVKGKHVSESGYTYKCVYTNGPEWTDSLTLLLQEAEDAEHVKPQNVMVTVLLQDPYYGGSLFWPCVAYEFDWSIGKRIFFDDLYMSNLVGIDYSLWYCGTIKAIKEGFFGGTKLLKFVDLDGKAPDNDPNSPELVYAKGGRIIQGIGITEWDDGECLFGPSNPYRALSSIHPEYPQRHYRSKLFHFERDGEVLFDVDKDDFLRNDTTSNYHPENHDELSANDVNIDPGKTAKLEIGLKNANEYYCALFDLKLPEGITIAKDDEGNYAVELSRWSNKHFAGVEPIEGGYRIGIITAYNEKYIAPGEGTMATITLQASDDAKSGIGKIIADGEANGSKTQSFFTEYGGPYYPKDVEFKVNVKEEAYRPFVEDGKVWAVRGIGISPDDNPMEQWIDYCYLDGDTIIGGQTCKRMMYIKNDNPSPLYIGAWYEQDKKVYFAGNDILRPDMYAYYSGGDNRPQFELLYDFTLSSGDNIQTPFNILWTVNKKSGGITGFKGTYYDLIYNDKVVEHWFEGVGSDSWPFYSHPRWIVGNVGGVLLECFVGDEVIYYNSEEDDPYSMGARKKRFDFTHTIKTKPKAPIQRETSDACISSSEREVARPKVKARKRTSAEAEQSLYGEYNDMQLGINLDPLDDDYQVRITDETGKVVYDKAVNAGNIVGLNIDISTYAKGRYTVTVENSKETFTGEFDAQTTGIEEVKSEQKDVRNKIYNLQGQRLNTLQKGLNIVNGRKVYVK